MPVVDEPDEERPEGAIETGLWCNRCMLPSAVKAYIHAFDSGTMQDLGPVGVVTICVDCGDRLDDNGDPITLL